MARAKRTKNIPQEILSLSFFYPELQNSQEATECIKRFNPGASGCYLLRLSSKGDNYLSLSVSINDHTVRHVNVIIENTRAGRQYYIVPEIKFRAFRELCQFYKEHRIGNLEKIDNVRLLYPINKRPDPSHPYETLGNVSSPVGNRVRTDPNSERNRMLPRTPSQFPSHLSMSLGGTSEITHRSGSSSSSMQDIVENRVSLDSQGNERRTSSGSFDEAGAASRQFFPAKQFHTNPALRESSITQNKSMKMNNDKSSRPPLPLPTCPKTDVYYSSPKDEKINKIENLRNMLKSSDICDCGIMLTESELPHGWTIHRSHESSSKDTLFYQDAKGITTWNFPQHLLLDITETQRQNIIRLCAQGGKEPPKVLFSPVRDKVMSELLAKKKRSEMSGQVFQPQSETFNPPSAQAQFDLATQVVPVNQQQQLKHMESSEPLNDQMECNPEFQTKQTIEPNGEQQYLSGTKLMYVPTSPLKTLISHSQTPTEPDHGLQSQPEQIHM